MASPLRTLLFTVAVLAVLTLACEDNTTCTIGTLLCTDAEGEVAQDGDQQLRECSDDEARGGDEDGEFVVIEDCAADGGACAVEFFAPGDELGGCVTRACADDGILDCLELGRTTCGFDSLLVCGVDAESGCQRYATDEACRDAGGTCVEENGEASCSVAIE